MHVRWHTFALGCSCRRHSSLHLPLICLRFLAVSELSLWGMDSDFAMLARRPTSPRHGNTCYVRMRVGFYTVWPQAEVAARKLSFNQNVPQAEGALADKLARIRFLCNSVEALCVSAEQNKNLASMPDASATDQLRNVVRAAGPWMQENFAKPMLSMLMKALLDALAEATLMVPAELDSILATQNRADARKKVMLQDKYEMMESVYEVSCLAFPAIHSYAFQP